MYSTEAEFAVRNNQVRLKRIVIEKDANRAQGQSRMNSQLPNIL